MQLSTSTYGLDLPAVCSGGHRFRWLPDGRQAYAAMLMQIATARREISMEFYICKRGDIADRFRAALIEACHRGVRIRVLLDAYGSDEVSGHFWHEFQEVGGDLRWFNPLRLLRLSFRNHRKLLLVDETATIATLNLADEHVGDGVVSGWRDLALEVGGPLVRELAASFDRQWALAGFNAGDLARFARSWPRTGTPSDQPALLLAGPGCRSAELRQALHRDLQRATRVDLHAAYFLPSWRLRKELRGAARRGRVRVLVPAHGDVPLAQLASRHALRRMDGQGIQFFDYLPQMLHSKLLVIDDIVYIGSANLDSRSRLINFELMLRLPVLELAAQARALFEHDLQYAQPSPPPTDSTWARLRERWAYLLLTRIDPYLARRKLRMLQ